MKKLWFAAFALMAFFFANAQDTKFGVKAGLFSSSYDAYRLHRDEYKDDYYIYDYYNVHGAYDTNASKVGFYVGGLVDFALVDKFRLQPELNLSFVPDSDAGYIALNLPVLVKYSFFDRFYAMAGPGFSYALDGDDDQFSPCFDLGATYDFMDSFFVEARVDIGLSGYLGSNFNAGVGYRFE